MTFFFLKETCVYVLIFLILIHTLSLISSFVFHINNKKKGCKRFIYVSKHQCGFVTWNSSVPNYNYTVNNAPNTMDIVAAFTSSARKYGVGYGFYYSML